MMSAAGPLLASCLSSLGATLSTWKDPLWAFLFAVNCLVIFSMALASAPMLSYQAHATMTKVINRDGIDSTEVFNDAPKLVGGIFLVLLLGGTLSMMWIGVLSRMAKEIVTLTFGAILVVTIISALSMFFQGLAMAGIFSLIVAVLSTGAFVYLRPRLEFATINMRVAAEAIKTMPATVGAASVVVLLEVVFCVLWMMAVVGYATNESDDVFVKNGVTYKLSQCVTYQYAWPLTIGNVNLACSGGPCRACVCDGSVVVRQGGPCFSPTLSGTAYFALLLSLLWVSEVFSNVVHVTTAGAVAHWWFHADHDLVDLPPSGASSHALVLPSSSTAAMALPHSEEEADGAYSSPSPTLTSVNALPTGALGGLQIVRPALARALTVSLGSICLGSLAVALLRTLHTVVHYASEKLRVAGRGGGCGGAAVRTLRACVSACLDAALRWLEAAVAFFNRYAFCYVALYGVDFVSASRSVMKMFSERGWMALINDDIVDVVLALGNVIGGVLLMYIAYGYAQGVGLSGTNVTVVTLLGLFAGFLFFQIAVKVISSAVATVYVCFAERPDVFETTHPALYRELQDAWTILYPNYRRMPPYDAEAVSVPPNKAFTFTFPQGGGEGGGGGGWNLYKPPTEAEVLAASRGAAAAAATGAGAGAGAPFETDAAAGVAGSSYKPIFVGAQLDTPAAPVAGGAAPGGGVAALSDLATSAYTSLASMVPRVTKVQYAYEQHAAAATNESLHLGDRRVPETPNPEEESVTF